MNTRQLYILLVAIVVAALALLASLTAAGAQRTFPSPEKASTALHDAVRANDKAALGAILGPGSREMIESGDPAEDAAGRARFDAAYRDGARIERVDAAHADLMLGHDGWRFPFPLAKSAAGWRFDTKAGRDEVIARRVGRNELAAMQAALAYVDAQREYALARHDGEGPGVYAERISSRPSRHDGLYWTPARGETLSPLGLAFTLAAADESQGANAQPYHGYFFRVLHAQGAHAKGGAGDYIVHGRMLGGFALVAWPARYRVSGVRTFIVNQDGIVHSRDLGARTAQLALEMERYDPDPGWSAETPVEAQSGDALRVRRLAGDMGCTVCHRDAPRERAATEAAPLAPTWREIASRYRGDPGAEEKITHTLIEGANPAERHWHERAEFTAMGANPRLTPDEARALARWVLSAR